jgi:hypothetical protein
MAIPSPRSNLGRWSAPGGSGAERGGLVQNGSLEAVLHALVLQLLPHPSLVSHIMITSRVVDSTTRMSSSNSASSTAESAGSGWSTVSAADIASLLVFRGEVVPPGLHVTSAQPAVGQEIVTRP